MTNKDFLARVEAGLKSGTVLSSVGYVGVGRGFVVTEIPEHRVVITMLVEDREPESITIPMDGVFHKWLMEIIEHVCQRFDFKADA